MIKPKLRLFFDESGNLDELKKKGFYFGCVVDYSVNYNLEKQLERVFKEKKKEWRSYHACKMKIKEKNINKEIVRLAKELYPELNIFVVKFQDNKKEVSYKFYYPILIETILFIIKNCEDKRAIDVILEHKENINQKELTSIISTLIKEKFNLKNPPALRISPQIKGDNIVLVLCDIVSNLAFSGDINFLKEIGAEIIDISKINLIKNKYSKIIDVLYDKNKKIIIGKKIITKEKITPLARKFVELLSTYPFQKNKKLNFQKALSLFEKEENNLGIVVEILREAKKYRENREWEKVIIFSEFVINAIEKFLFEDKNAYMPFLEAVNSWLVGYNHLGEFMAEHEYIVKAKELSENLKSDTNYFESIANLYNHIAVSYQNIFAFSQAAAQIKPCVEFFEQQQRGPFGKPISCRYIGTLFGNYSQCLFFKAYWEFLENVLRGANIAKAEEILVQTIDEGILYSQESENHFTDVLERQRQAIYRAQANFSLFILTDREEFLEKGKNELNIHGDFKLNNFLKKIDSLSSNEIYWLAAVLKYMWLKKLLFTSALDQKIISKLNTLPPEHPYEQILGYVALMGCKEAKTFLKNKKWDALVRYIALFFRLQIDWKEQKKINDDFVKELQRCNCSSFILNSIPVDSHVETICSKLDEYSFYKGPLTLLPFNYS